jgi:hypothetical protein
MVLDDQDLWQSVMECLRPMLGQAIAEPLQEGV